MGTAHLFDIWRRRLDQLVQVLLPVRLQCAPLHAIPPLSIRFSLFLLPYIVSPLQTNEPVNPVFFPRNSEIRDVAEWSRAHVAAGSALLSRKRLVVQGIDES